MSYTRNFDVTAPPGSELAKNIDNQIRNFRTDVKERLDTILRTVESPATGEKIDQDPLQLLKEITGEVTSKKMNIAFGAFAASSIGKEYYYDDDKLIAFTDTDVLVAPLILPIGVIVTKVELLADKSSAGTITWKVKWRPFGAGTTQTAETVVHTAVGLSVSFTTINPLINGVNENNTYWMAIEGTGTAGNAFYIYGARVTYDTPSSKNTL